MKNKKDLFSAKEWYRAKIVEMINNIHSELYLSRVYAVVKHLNDKTGN